MTETQTTGRPLPAIGQAVGLAEAALTAMLASVASRKPSRHRCLHPRPERCAPAGRPGGSLTRQRAGIGRPDPAGRWNGQDGPAVELTAGEALWDRIRQSAGRVTAEVLALFDADDIETTIRTLQAITARVRELHAR